jgi:hypothetical protein
MRQRCPAINTSGTRTSRTIGDEMRLHARRLFTLLPAAVLLYALTAAGSGAARDLSHESFKVTSTLQGKTVLPHRIHWYATTPGTKLKRMEFLIDGKLRWLEKVSPYIYGDQSNDAGTVDRGYLVTSWLTPGTHTFSARATAKDGRTATNTVTARVTPTPNPPAALAGTWKRTIDPAGAPKPGTPGAPKDTPTPAGQYTITFDKRWIQIRNPGTFTHASVDNNTGLGYIQDTDYTPGPTSFRVWGAVSWRPFSDYLAEEGTWCLPWGGPEADYRWSVTGDTLTLAPSSGNEPCRVRQFILTGDWTRTG